MATRLVDLNDNALEEWQGPWQITGPEGSPGEDGKGIEFIYTRTNSSDAPSANPNSHVGTIPDGNGGRIEATYNNTLDDFVPNGWHDNPIGVEPDMQYEWACVRTSDREGKWSDFIGPFLWSHWGQNGLDGDGVEYIFHANTNGFPTTDPSEWNANDASEYIPDAQKTIWFDDPVDLETLGPGAKEWVCIRKKKNGHWGKYSAPALWARFAADGVAVGYTVDLTNPTIPVSLNADGSSGTGYIQASCGVQVFQNGVPVNNFTISNIDYAKISGHSVQNNSNSSANYLQISPDQSTKEIYISMRNLQNFSNKVITIPVDIVIGDVIVKRSINIVGVSVGVTGATVDLWTSAKAIRTNYAQTRCVPSDLEVGLKITTMEGNTPNTQLYKYSQIPSQYSGLFTFKYYYNDEVNTNNAITINNGIITNLSAAKESIIVLMLYNGYIIDSDEIPYVHDGAPFIGDGPIVYSIDVESSSLRVRQNVSNNWVYSGSVGFTVSKKVNDIASSGQVSTHIYKMGYDTDHYTFIDGSSSGYDNESLVINIGGQTVTGTYANNKWTAQVSTDTAYTDGTTPAFANIQVLNATHTVVASVVVPFAIDGVKGSAAQALNQPVFRFLSWEELKANYALDNTNNPTLKDGTTPESNGITYLDIIYTNDGHYYRVKEAKTFSQVITVSGDVISMNMDWFWEFTNLGNAVFQTILARNAFIQNLNSRELVITDSNSNPVAGITSSTAVTGDGQAINGVTRGDVRIWAGSPTKTVNGVTTTNLTNCPFYVTNAGVAHVEGYVDATSFRVIDNGAPSVVFTTMRDDYRGVGFENLNSSGIANGEPIGIVYSGGAPKYFFSFTRLGSFSANPELTYNITSGTTAGKINIQPGSTVYYVTDSSDTNYQKYITSPVSNGTLADTTSNASAKYERRAFTFSAFDYNSTMITNVSVYRQIVFDSGVKKYTGYGFLVVGNTTGTDLTTYKISQNTTSINVSSYQGFASSSYTVHYLETSNSDAISFGTTQSDSMVGIVESQGANIINVTDRNVFTYNWSNNWEDLSSSMYTGNNAE